MLRTDTRKFRDRLSWHAPGLGVPLVAGLICFLWALAGWLTVIPNQDILADGIQAQSILSDPRIVLSFPGQKHGGPLEYPATLLAEWILPGNYFANAAIRPVLAFATGFVVALLFRALFPSAPSWALLAAMATGPTIIHGLLGPEGNPVGVWWLQPNWDMAWLLVSSGALVLTKSRLLSPLGMFLGGLLVGLGLFAHPAIVLLILPLMVLVCLRTIPRLPQATVALVGAGVGVIPAAISYVVNARINTWDPSHGAFIAVDYYWDMGRAVLGLDGIPDYMFALLPFGIGLAPSQTTLSAIVQSVLVGLFVATVTVAALIASIHAVRSRQPLSAGGAIAVAWVAAFLGFILFITFVDPVWIYSSGLAILYWITVGALPAVITPRILAVSITVVWIGISAVSTLGHNWNFYSKFGDRVTSKIEVMNQQQAIARALDRENVDVIFGSYYDAIPIGYASGGQLRTITNRYNRFPLTPQELDAGPLAIAIKKYPREDWGIESLEHVQRECAPAQDSLLPELDDFLLFECPPSALVFNR